jgi:hypothetical protein
MKIVQFVFLSNLIALTLQQDETEDGDECAFISGQHCDQNGICKYCAMCIQSSCILSKTTNCNTTQFGTTDLYNWYDYCLSSENDSDGGSTCYLNNRDLC